MRRIPRNLALTTSCGFLILVLLAVFRVVTSDRAQSLAPGSPSPALDELTSTASLSRGPVEVSSAGKTRPASEPQKTAETHIKPLRDSESRPPERAPQLSPTLPALRTAAPENSLPPCKLLTFAHLKTRGHEEPEDCAQHRNVITLGAPKNGQIFASTLCVKVDGKPVSFQYHAAQRELHLAPLAGPDSLITVRYCTVPVRCEDACTPSKDEFLEAIAGNDDDSLGDTQNAWGSKEKPVQISAKVAEELASAAERKPFSQWKEKSSADPMTVPSEEDRQISRQCALPNRKVARQ